MNKLENDQRISTQHLDSNIRQEKVERNQLVKEFSKNDEKIKEIIERNERLENECLKFKIQTNTDTSSNFILPSEFRKCWEDFANKDLSDCFIDFYDHPLEAFQLIQEFIYLSIEILDEQTEIILNGILSLLNLPQDKNLKKTQIENVLKPIFKENYQFIFDSENISEIYFTQLKQKFQEFFKNNLKNSEKVDEFEDLISSRSFKNSVANIKKIVFYLKFNGEQLQFKIDKINERRKLIKTFNKNECICVQGFIKISKNCLVLLSPPIMKNGYPYQNLKPVVIEYDGEISDTLIEEDTQAAKSKEGEIRTEQMEKNLDKTAHEQHINNPNEENEKSNLLYRLKSDINKQEVNSHGETIINICNNEFIDNIRTNVSLPNSPKNKVLGMSSSQKYLINYKLSADILLSISEIEHKLPIENNSSNGEMEKNDNIKSHRVISKAKKSVINKIKSLTVTPNDKENQEKSKNQNGPEVNKNLLQNKSSNFKEKFVEKIFGEVKDNNNNIKQTDADLIQNSINDSNPTSNNNNNNVIKYSQINLCEILLTPESNHSQPILKQKEKNPHHQNESLSNKPSQSNPKIKKERNFIKTNLDILFKEKNNFFEKEGKPQNKSTLQENCENIYSSRSQIDFNTKDKNNFNYLTEYDMANLRIATDNENSFKNVKECITSDSQGAPSINASSSNTNANSNSTFKFYNKKHRSKPSDNLVDIIDSLESEIYLEKENRGDREINKDLNIFFSQSINKNSTQASTLKNYNLDSEKIVNKSEKNFMNNSHKKNTNKGTMFIFQTTDRSSENNINAINEKQNKNSSLYFRTGINKLTGGSLSKTPKFQKQGLDSPREFTTNTILFNNYAKSGTGMDKSLKEKRENNLNNNGDFLPGKNLNHQFSNSNIGNYSASFQSQNRKNSSKKNKISNVDDSENSSNINDEKSQHQNYDDNISRGGLTSPKQRNFSAKLKENLTKKKKTNNFLISNIKTVQSSTLNHMQSMNSYNSTLNLHSSTSINMQMLTKNKNKAYTKSKGFEDGGISNKRKLIQKETSVNKQPVNKSIDRKIFENRTNAEIKINVDELLSVKRGEKGKESPAIKELSRVKSSKDGLNIAKTHYLNIKYV